MWLLFFFFKQKTAYEMRISDWSSDVCSSDLRADFPGGDARQLYRSIRKLLSLPDDTRLFLCHDYKAPDRDDYRWETTVGEQRRASVHVHDGVSEDEFVALREARDATLAVPTWMLPSILVQILGGWFADSGPKDGQLPPLPP